MWVKFQLRHKVQSLARNSGNRNPGVSQFSHPNHSAWNWGPNIHAQHRPENGDNAYCITTHEWCCMVWLDIIFDVIVSEFSLCHFFNASCLWGCNTCRCGESGLKNHSACTLMACPPSMLPSTDISELGIWRLGIRGQRVVKNVSLHLVFSCFWFLDRHQTIEDCLKYANLWSDDHFFDMSGKFVFGSTCPSRWWYDMLTPVWNLPAWLGWTSPIECKEFIYCNTPGWSCPLHTWCSKGNAMCFLWHKQKLIDALNGFHGLMIWKATLPIIMVQRQIGSSQRSVSFTWVLFHWNDWFWERSARNIMKKLAQDGFASAIVHKSTSFDDISPELPGVLRFKNP